MVGFFIDLNALISSDLHLTEVVAEKEKGLNENR
jgi:hypothetical protein